MGDKKKSKRLLVCTKGKHCAKRGGREVADALEADAKALQSDLEIVRCKCLGECDHGPAVIYMPDKVKHRKVTPEAARQILEEPDVPTKRGVPKEKKKKKRD